MFVEVLKGPAIISLCLQKPDCDIVNGLKQTLKTVNSLTSLRKKDPSEWPTVKLVQDRVVSEGSCDSYQGAVLIHIPLLHLSFVRSKLWVMLKGCTRPFRKD